MSKVLGDPMISFKKLLVFASLILQLSCTPQSQTIKHADSASGKKEDSKTSKTRNQSTRDESSGDAQTASTADGASKLPPTTTSPASISPTPLPGAEDCLGAEPFICKTELAITRYVNELRVSQGVFAYNAKLAFVARDWSKRQADAGKTGHDGFPQQRSALYTSTFGTTESISVLAENTVSYDDCTGSTSADEIGKAIFDLWAASQKHKNIMLSNTSKFGIGVWKSGTTYYATQIFGN